MAFGANDAVDSAEVSMQDMPEEEKKRVERLVLRGSRDLVLHCQRGKEAANFLVTELGRRPAAHKRLEPRDPEPISFKSASGIITELYSGFQVTEFLFPG